jgi:hypothetical protein
VRSDRQEGRTERQGTRQEQRTERQGTRQEQRTDRQGQRQTAVNEAYDNRYHDHDDWDDDWDDYWGAAAVGAAVAVTAYAIGTTITASAFAALPCTSTTIVAGGVTYYQCGTTWYQPAYSGGGVTYVVVNPPAGY